MERPEDVWLEDDGERTDEPAGLTLDAGGLVDVRSGRRTRAAWSDVLGVAVVERRVYVLVPRRPPHPPWIELDEGTHGRDPDDLAREIRDRSQRAGYREARLERALLAPKQLLARVLARDDVAGAVEVPAKLAPPRPRHEGLFAMTGGAAGSAVGFGALLTLHLPEAVLQLAGYPIIGLGILGIVAGVKIARALPSRSQARPRVMVLAPDGIVASLDGKVRALRWDRIERIDRAVEADGAGDVEERLRVTTTRGRKHRIDVRWLDAPIELVLAIAETYRARWSAVCARNADREPE